MDVHKIYLCNLQSLGSIAYMVGRTKRLAIINAMWSVKERCGCGVYCNGSTVFYHPRSVMTESNKTMARVFAAHYRDLFSCHNVRVVLGRAMVPNVSIYCCGAFVVSLMFSSSIICVRSYRDRVIYLDYNDQGCISRFDRNLLQRVRRLSIKGCSNGR